MALLRVANLCKSYTVTATQKQQVLNGIDVEFKSGDLVALLGESGCGKSTLINILGGLDNDYTGSVVIKGDFIRDYTEKQMDDYRKKRVGLIFQNYNLIPHMSIKDNIKIAMEMSDVDEGVCETRAMDLLELIGLNEYADKLPAVLSGGQKQRVAIARALANNPTIILADEPTGALDAESADVILQILKKIALSGKLVIIVTHSEKVASECCRVLKMENGKIASDTYIRNMQINKSRDKEIRPKSIGTKRILGIAYKNFKRKSGRNMLVSVGTAIGMAAVILILCLSSGLTKYATDTYSATNDALQMVVTTNDGNAIRSSALTNIENHNGVGSVTKTQVIKSLSCKANGKEITLNNVHTYYASEFVPELLYGEIKSDTLDKRYALISEKTAETLDNEHYIACVGETITFGGYTFTVSGIYRDAYLSGGANALISAQSIASICGDASSVNMLYVTAKDATVVSALASDISVLGLNVYRADSSVDEVMEYIDLGTNVLTAVGCVSLAVSAILIFIVLYITVNERMKEIGILRAIGARKNDIRKMFIAEAGIIGLAAGIIAVTASVVITIITNAICLATLEYSIISYGFGYYAAGALACIIISILAGISPAMHASDLDPVEALRAE